jgi:hypothetical protein
MARAQRAAAVPVEPSAPAPVEPPAPALSVVPPVSPQPPESSPPDLFDAAFAEAAAAEGEGASAAAPPKKPPATPAPAPAKPSVAPPASPEPPQPESPTGEPLPPQPPERSPQPQPQNPPPQPPPPPPQPPEQAPLQPPQPQPPPPSPQPQPQPQPQAYQEPPLFSAEEANQLQSFYADWPDVARATETMIRGLLAQTARRMYADMASSLAPYLRTIDTLADRSQLSELQEQVPDYETISTQLNSWVDKQPAYLRGAYEHVIKAGTAAEVVDLINRYKQDMQSTTPAQGDQPAPAAAAASAPAPAPSASAPPVNPALAAAAARLAPVATKRTSVVAMPADFDSAFAEFAKAS